MNDEQLNNLFARARQASRDTTRAEYGFETRLLARLRDSRPASPWALWTWRLMPFFAAAVIAVGFWSYLSQTDISMELALEGAGNGATLAHTFTGDYND